MAHDTAPEEGRGDSSVSPSPDSQLPRNDNEPQEASRTETHGSTVLPDPVRQEAEAGAQEVLGGSGASGAGLGDISVVPQGPIVKPEAAALPRVNDDHSRNDSEDYCRRNGDLRNPDSISPFHDGNAGEVNGEANDRRTARFVEFPPLRAVESKPAKSAKKAKKASNPKGKIVSTKEECDWLKRYFQPLKRKDVVGSWTVKNSGAGFDVLFRVKRSSTEPEDINLTFPYISRAMFTTLKGLNDEQRSNIIADYVAGHIEKQRQHDDADIRCKADRVAARLTVAS